MDTCTSGELILQFVMFNFKYRWAQEEVGVALGVLTEGSIEKCNQDVKFTNTRFVARTSMENIHRNIITRMSWEADPLLHYEETVLQVKSFYSF